MKPIHKIIFFTALFLGSIAGIHAQNIVDNSIYRVTAYKQGNNTVTSTSNYAEIIPPLNLYIPSAFTPNGDGLNDTFGVKGEGINNYHIYIYNRWGEVVFESTNPKQTWDGKFKGNNSETGTYVYQLFAEGLSKKGKTGIVSVVY